MRTKLVTFITAFLLITLCVSMTGCFGGSGIGTTHKTKWFDFIVHSIEKVDSYAGYVARPGYQLYDVLITEKNTFTDDIPMGTFDFFMQSSNDKSTYWEPLEALNSTMMPEDFTLTPGQSAQYHMVFEIPSNVTKLELIYIEFDIGGNQGNTFTIKVK